MFYWGHRKPWIFTQCFCFALTKDTFRTFYWTRQRFFFFLLPPNLISILRVFSFRRIRSIWHICQYWENNGKTNCAPSFKKKKISDWIHSKLERKSYQSRPHEVLSHWTVKLYSKKRLWCPCAMVSSIWRRNPISQRSGAIEKRFRKGFTWRSWVWILIMAQPSVAGCQESNIGDRRDGNTSSPVNHSDTKQS